MKQKINPFIQIESVDDSRFLTELKTSESVLEYDCSLEVIKNLVDLYTLAIQTYEPVKDPKYLTYKKKLDKLLTRPDVQYQIRDSCSASGLHIKSKTPKNNSTKFKFELDLESDRMVEKALEYHKNETEISTEKLQENLKQQMEILSLRLSSRKRQTEKNSKFLAFEKGIEEIMEEYITEKLKIKESVKNKYKSLLEEFYNMPCNNIVINLIEEINTRMSEEIAESVKVIEQDKREKILNLKSSINLSQ
jgi:hypothetical protein